MAIYNAGNAYLQILPSFRGIERLMQRETRRLAQAIDRSVAQGASDGLIEAFRGVNIAPQRTQRAAQESADRWATAFRRQLSQRLRDAAESLPVFEPEADLDRFDQAIQQTRRELAELANTRIGERGDIGFDQLDQRLESIVDRMRRLGDEAQDAERKTRILAAAGQAETLRGLLSDARSAGLEGRTYGGAFADEARKTIAQALRNLPDVNVDADISAAERELALLRERLQSLGDMRIGIDIDRDEFLAQLDRVSDQLDVFSRQPHSVALQFDLDRAAAGLASFREKIGPAVEGQVGEVADEAGDVFAGRFADSVRRRIAAAVQALPNIELDADASDADREIREIRAQLEALGRRTVGVDLDAGQAQEQLNALLARLQALDNRDVDIDVRINAAAAAAEIRAIEGATDDCGVSMRELGREAGITMSRLGYLVVIGASLGSVVAPAAATAAVAIAGIGTAVAAAVLGFGALALGVVGIADAVGKIDKYQQDADKSARSFSQAQNRVTSALNSVKQAEQSLADAREDAADANTDAQRRIADAHRNVGRAQRDAADAVRRARENEREAIAAIANARRDAAEAIEDAIESQEDAQRSLTRANKDAKEARQDLNEALKEAVQDLRDLDTAVKRNANEISKAQTDAMKAKLELDKILTNPRASEIEKRMAREKYDAELIQIEELKNQQQDLAKQKAEADKRGVESTDRVKQARERVADADERAADAQRRLVDAQERVVEARLDGMERVQAAEKRAAEAQRAVAKAQADGAERVADAQRAVADAQRDAIRTQRNGARSVAGAQQRLADANRALGQSYEGLGVAGGEAFDNMQDALDELSPAGRRFARWLYGLKPYLDELRSTAQNGFLPGLQEGLQILISNYLPAFDAFLGRITRGMGAMFKATAQVFTLPEWREFFSFVADRALPAMQNAWVASLNLARGVANLVKALDPLSSEMGSGLVNMTERFARWSDQLETDPAFQEFLAYAQDVAPRVIHLIGEMVEFIGRLVAALAPIGSILIDAFTATFEWINSWDIDTLTTVVSVVSVLAGGILLLTGFVRTVRFVTELWNAITLITAASQSVLTAAVTRYNAATVTATTATGLLNGRLFAAGTAGAAGAAGMGAMTAAAGPLGVALAGLGAIWYLNWRQQRQADEATDELADGFQELARAFKTAAETGDESGRLISDTFARLVVNNEDMQQTVLTLTDMGASLEDIAGAAAGSSEELTKVLDLIDRRIEQLKQEKDENFFSIFDNEERTNEMERLWKLQERLKESGEQAKVASEAMQILNGAQKDVAYSAQMATPAELALAEAHRVLSDESADAQQKMDALAKAEEAIRKGAVDAIEASEQWNSSLLTLKESVKQSKDAHDKHATSLGMGTQTGLRNRDMLENLIESSNRMYDADVALNGITQSAIDKGKSHVDQIKKVAKELGFNKTETQKLIDAYSRVPKNVNTAVTMDDKSFQKVYKDLQRLQWMQTALRLDLSPAEAEAMWNRRDYPKGSTGYADGGHVHGPGSHTSDSINARLSDGEFVQPYDAVSYYGADVMEAMRHKRIPREMLPGFASGGFVQTPKITVPMRPSLDNVYIPDEDDIYNWTFGGGFDGSLGDARGGRGWKWQMSTLRKVFPGLRLISGFRKGSRTLSGNLSWHARGRAVDVPPKRAVAEYIARTFGRNTLELITPWRDLMLYKGKPHKFSRAVERQHGVGSAGNDHVHWAFDQGGYLPPGYSTVFNGTGRPEPVLTPPQWEAIISDRREDGSPRVVYNIEFAENKLTLADLQAHERRQAALDRVGRAR